jgi:hypothetical protein
MDDRGNPGGGIGALGVRIHKRKLIKSKTRSLREKVSKPPPALPQSAFSTQIAGHAAGNANFLDLTNFSRNKALLRAVFEFLRPNLRLMESSMHFRRTDAVLRLAILTTVLTWFAQTLSEAADAVTLRTSIKGHRFQPTDRPTTACVDAHPRRKQMRPFITAPVSFLVKSYPDRQSGRQTKSRLASTGPDQGIALPTFQ